MPGRFAAQRKVRSVFRRHTVRAKLTRSVIIWPPVRNDHFQSALSPSPNRPQANQAENHLCSSSKYSFNTQIVFQVRKATIIQYLQSRRVRYDDVNTLCGRRTLSSSSETLAVAGIRQLSGFQSTVEITHCIGRGIRSWPW